MKSIVSMFEGLFDIEDHVAKFDANLVDVWLKDNTKGNYKYQVLKNGNFKINGTLIIKGIEEDHLPAALKIASVINGGVVIEKCPNLTNIEGLFTDDVKFDGDLSINNCPNLVSIKGMPRTVHGSISVVGNKSLKSLEGLPWIIDGFCYVMKNGKKFKEDDIIKDMIGAHQIVCSVEDESMMIVESLGEPHLLALDKQLKTDKPGFGFADIFNPKCWRGRTSKFNVSLSEIDASNVKDYKTITNTTLTAIRNVISSVNGKGFILLRNFEGEYVGVISDRKEVFKIKRLDRGWDPYQTGRWQNSDYTAIMDWISNAYSCVIISWVTDDQNDYLIKRNDRANAKSGMLLNTKEQNERIASKNRERYRQMAVQIRAERKNKEVDEIADKVDDIMKRYMKLMRASVSDLSLSNWKISEINDLISDRRHYVKGERRGDNGLLYYYEEYIETYRRLREGDSSHATSLERSAEEYKRHIESYIEGLDRRLKKLGF